MDELLAKRKVLEETLAGYRAVVVAFSGGVDSAFLTAVAHEVLGPAALAVTAVSPSLARRELKAAEDLARGYRWNHRLVETHEVERPEYARNAPDRCYWCKHELFEVLAPIAAEAGAEIAVGTNADDLGDHRPGLRAARERDVRSPLVDAGIGKPDVRALAARMGLPVSDKPASPCLASRFAYGVEVTPERLRRVDAAEEIVRALGFEVLRVRDHGDLARIEVPAEDLPRAAAARAELHRELAGLGFRFVTLDLGGFRSGSLNAVLGGPKIVRPE
ncbi:MAG: ATP-dependent sacrificial sulfur transferase LarE [Actinomycetota bacterium]|nr:ATP-dependent sacrificial sulfur transferase LarE [Actinomycetota bacterium]